MRPKKRRLLVLGLVLATTACLARRGDGDDGIEGTLTVGGRERAYHLHAPKGRDRKKAAPLLIVLHGGGGNGPSTAKVTRHRFDELADRDGWLVVYPDGVEKNWNDGRRLDRSKAHAWNVDDVEFISSLLDELIAKENVDPKRVFATGISNGGFMSHRLARELSSRIAAIAPVAANLHEAADVAIVPSRAVSVLAINGTKDPLVPFEGGDVRFLWQSRGRCRSTRDTIDWWVQTDGCSKEAVVSDDPDRDPKDGTRVRREVHGGGKDGAEVVLLEVTNGGHTWPGGVPYAPEALIGKTCRDLDACDEIWEFFKKHPIR